MSKRPICVLTLAATLTMSLAANSSLAAAEGIAPRFYDSEKPVYKRSKDKLEVTTKYQDTAYTMAGMYKGMIERNKHKGSFHTDKHTFYLDDLTSKKSFVITSKYMVRKKVSTSAYTTLQAMFPNNIQILRELQAAYDDQGDWTKAHETYTKLRQLEAKKEEENKNSPMARERHSRHLAPHIDDSTDAYYVLQMGHYQTAIKQLNSLIEKNPEAITNYKNRALAYRKLKKYDLAIKDEKKIAEMQKARAAEGEPERSARMHHFKSDFQKSTRFLVFNLFEQALSEADKELAAHPDSISSLMAKADAEAMLGRYALALADYKKLQAKDPQINRIKSTIGDMTILASKGPAPYGDLQLLKSHEGSMPAHANRPGGKDLSEIAADHKGDYRVYRAIAEAAREQGRWPERKAELDKMYAISNGSDTLFSEIEATQALGKWADTEKLCDRFIKDLASSEIPGVQLDEIEYVFMIRALCRQVAKNYTGAIEDDTLLLKLEPGSLQILKDRAACYEKSGKPDLARADMAAAGKTATPD